MLPDFLWNHVLSFVDFHSIMKFKLISVPVVYRYLLILAVFVKNMGHQAKGTVLETLEPFFHLNRYQGLNISIIYYFIKGTRYYGNNITYGLTRELWVHNFQWHRSYGPAVIYRGCTHPYPFREGWYIDGNKVNLEDANLNGSI